MSTEEENKEEKPVFSFKEIPTETENPIEDVVILKEEEKVDPPTPPDPPAEDKKPEENPENKKPEDKKGEENPDDKKPDDKKEEEVLDLNDELAFKYLKENKGLEFESLEDFLKSKEPKKLDPEIEKYLEFKEKTGRGYADFLETQREWAKESPEVLIKAVIKLNNPSLTSDEIDFLFERDFAYDEEIDDEADVKEKKINQKIEAKKALAFLEKQKEDYAVPRGSDEANIPEEYRDAKDLVDKLYEESVENEQNAKILRDDFVSKITAHLNDKFDGIKFTVEGKDFKYKPEDVKQVLESVLDIGNFQKPYFDKDNKLKDEAGYTKTLLGGLHIDKIFQFAYNQGKTDYAEELEKNSKNIDVKGEKHLPSPSVLEGFTFKKA